MKKILASVFAAFLLLTCVKTYAVDIAGIYDKYQVVYSPKAASWAKGGMAPDRIVLTKKTVSGSGSYSEYYDSKGKLAVALGSNFEFISGNKLVAVHNSDLKFYQVVYKNGKFSETQMTEKEVQALFPKAQIIKISEFKKGKIKVNKGDTDKEFILLNDTKDSFYKYSYKPEDVKTTDVASLIKVTKKGKITFSHYGDNAKTAPKFVINVKK